MTEFARFCGTRKRQIHSKFLVKLCDVVDPIVLILSLIMRITHLFGCILKIQNILFCFSP